MSILRAPISEKDHVQGAASAPVTLVEYGDYECPYCGLAHPIVKALQTAFGRELRFIFRHFPLTQVHPNAQIAAESAEFAGAHERFWDMHDGLYENQSNLGPPLLFTLARTLQLSDVELRDSLEEGVYRQRVRDDFMGGVRSGVNGTPTFFVNGIRHDGSFAFESLVSSIEEGRRRLPTAI